MVGRYRDLVAWQRAMELVAKIYLTTALLPQDERFGLTSQLRRAAVSIPSALAEGHARSSTKEFVRYISIAMGSLAELETQLLICTKLQLLAEDAVHSLLMLCDEQSRILHGLRKSLASKLTERAPTSNALTSP
ncbi:MAG TPA: four helix bundle protein [Rudaea sp.]|nr:four helix bundle protein [Rudaea sp.]